MISVMIKGHGVFNAVPAHVNEVLDKRVHEPAHKLWAEIAERTGTQPSDWPEGKATALIVLASFNPDNPF